MAGLVDVAGALNEARVAALLLEADVELAGHRDPATGMLSLDPRESPTEGAMEDVDDFTDELIAKTLEQAADVHVGRERPELGPLGGIGAILRF